MLCEHKDERKRYSAGKAENGALAVPHFQVIDRVFL